MDPVSVVMLGLAMMAFPGQVPRGLSLVMQPFGVLLKVLVVMVMQRWFVKGLVETEK